MKYYTCPMHPEIRQNKPGRCPICHMRLTAGDKAMENMHVSTASWKNYMPLFVIICLIFITSGVISLSSEAAGISPLRAFITTFMTGFFLVFSGFKLMDIRGFAEGYATYDLLAMRFPGYGYVYPFLELFFGLAMILFPASRLLLGAEFLLMAFSGLGVALKLAKKKAFQCACLGTFLKVPLTKVTLIEDFGMAALALLLLLI